MSASRRPAVAAGRRPYDLVTFGETMVRLTTEPGVRLEEAGTLQVTIGGAESNVAVALARLGRRTAWLSALPENALGQRIAGELRRHGVDTTHVLWATGRAGVYFMEPGATPRPTRVLYDRAESAIAQIDPSALDISVIADSGALHLTGITPALSTGCQAACQRLLDAAADAGVPVSVDVNYRARLWPPEAAAAGIQPLLDRATLLFCGASDAATIWGPTGQPVGVAEKLLDRSAASVVVVTFGEDGSLALTREGVLYNQPALPVTPIDPVGAGDAFAAGFLHRWLDDPTDISTALRSGAALAALKMTIYGDNAVISPDDLVMLDGPAADIIR